MRKPSFKNVAAGLILPGIVLLLASGCGGNSEEGETGLRAEAREWRDKYESLVNQNEIAYQKLTALRTDNENLQKERDALKEQFEGLQMAPKLKEELAEAKKRATELEQQVAQLRQGLPVPPGPEGAAPKELGARADEVRRRLELLSAALFERDEHNIAQAVLLSAQQLGSQTPQTFYQLAYCEAAAGNYEAATDWYERALAALGEGVKEDEDLRKKCLINCGVAKERLGESEKARELYQKAVALDDAYAPAYFNLGLLYAKELNNPDAAVEALRKHIINGGSRSMAARDFIRELQAAQTEQEEPAAP